MSRYSSLTDLRHCNLQELSAHMRHEELRSLGVVFCQDCVHAKEYVLGRIYCTNPDNRARVGLDGVVHDCDAFLTSPSGYCEKGATKI